MGYSKAICTGFSLLELMVVVAILTLVTAFAIPALTTLSTSSGLSSGGRIVSNLLTVARSEAINRRAPVRFEVATAWPAESSQAYRKITLVQHDPVTGNDTQITGWQTLPNGIAVNSSNSSKYFFSNTVSQTQTPSLALGGQAIATRYIEFSPTGAPNIDPQYAPVTVLVVAAYNVSKLPTQIVGVAGVNYYAINVDALIGKPVVARP